MGEEKTIETKILSVSSKEGSMPGLFIKPDGEEAKWVNAIDMQAVEEIKKLQKFETAKLILVKGQSGKWFVSKAVKTRDAEQNFKKGNWQPRKPEDPYNNITTNNGIIVQAANYILETTKNKPLNAKSWAVLMAEFVGETKKAFKDKQVFGEHKSSNDASEEDIV